MAAGQFVQVPMINGGNREELRLYVAYAAQDGKHVTAQNYAASLKAVYGGKASLVLAEYPVSGSHPHLLPWAVSCRTSGRIMG
jgi:para-nitrobenzyl esterase